MSGADKPPEFSLCDVRCGTASASCGRRPSGFSQFNLEIVEGAERNLDDARPEILFLRYQRAGAQFQLKRDRPRHRIGDAEAAARVLASMQSARIWDWGPWRSSASSSMQPGT
jgi:hypothetical protein